MSLLELPVELLLHIFQYLIFTKLESPWNRREFQKESHPLVQLYQTCRQLRELILAEPYLLCNEHVLSCQLTCNHAWRQAYVRRFLEALNSCSIRIVIKNIGRIRGMNPTEVGYCWHLYKLRQELVTTLPLPGSGFTIPDQFMAEWLANFQRLFRSYLLTPVTPHNIYEMIELSLLIYDLAVNSWNSGNVTNNGTQVSDSQLGRDSPVNTTQ